MKKSIIKLFCLVLNLLVMSCYGQTDKIIMLKSKEDLNRFCSVDSVYDINEIDSLLYKKIVNNIPNIFSTFKLSVKSSNVGVYQIGNVGNCIDCTRTTYFFIVYHKEIMLFNNNHEIQTIQSVLNRLENEGKLNTDEKAILIAKIKKIIIVNQSEEKSRETRRW